MKSVSVEGHLWKDDTKYDRSLILVKFGAFWGLIELKLSGIRFGLLGFELGLKLEQCQNTCNLGTP